LEKHVRLLDSLATFNKEKTGQHLRAIMGNARTNAEDYIIPSLKSELDKAEDYLESAWLVNKYPDELSVIRDAMAAVRNSEINIQTGKGYLSELMDAVRYRKERIEYYIETIQQEREVVGLPSLTKHH